jgi:hydroxymethylpyrimidine pyrophosphatase-like HAD family hydrolase
MLPVDAVVGENGAFVFSYENRIKKMHREVYFDKQSSDPALSKLRDEIMAGFPGVRVSGDQEFRWADLAIDFAEDVDPVLSIQVAEQISNFAQKRGFCSKISTIHVNIWKGNFDKKSTLQTFCERKFGISLNQVLYIGDSPNDAPLFESARISVGVANVADFPSLNPNFVTTKRSGEGFAEFVEHLKDKFRVV